MGSTQQKQEMRGDFSNHQRLKNYKIIKRRNGKQYMEVPCPIYDTKIIPQWQNNIRSIQKKQCLFLPEEFQIVEEGRCGSSGTLKIIFEYYPFSLQKEIANRRELKSPFNQQQLWFLLYEITSSVTEFQNIGKKSGDIRPKNIFINEEGLIKVVTQYSFPDERVNYLKALEDYESAYLAPEQLAQFQKGIVHSRSDPVLGEAFSIGLTMLDAALLTDNQELYQMKNLRFNIHKFHENIIKWKQSNYSPFLIRTVENLLQINWYERPTAGEVRAVLEPYEDQIRNLELFTPSKSKSKAMLDSYQTGTKVKKSPQQQQHKINPSIFNPEIKPSSSPYSPVSPINHTINPVKIHTYPQHQIPFSTHPTSPQTFIPPIKNHQNYEPRITHQRFNSTDKYSSHNNFMNYKVPLSPQPQFIRNNGRQIMIPASRVKVVPNSRPYLQIQQIQHPQSHRF